MAGTRYSVRGASTQKVKNAGGTDIKETKYVGVVFASLTLEQADKLRAQGFKITPVNKVTASQIEIPPTPEAEPLYSLGLLVGLAKFDAWAGIYEPPLKGTGLFAAIIDTGIRDTHELVNGRVVYKENFTADVMKDEFDHGTSVASALLVQAPECSLLDLKVLDSKGEGSTESVALAIDHCIEMWEQGHEFAPVLINLSLGGPDTGDPDDPIRVASRAAVEEGIWVNAAAGNYGPEGGTITSPACEKYIFATGSAKLIPLGNDTYDFQVSEFSSRGPTKEGLVKPDAIFFGEDIICASSKNDTATVAKSGTSFATPFTTGIAVLFIESYIRDYIDWLERAKLAFPGVPEEELRPPEDPVTLTELIDHYLQYITINPAGFGAPKTNEYGHGLPFGDRLIQLGTAAPSIGIETLTPIIAFGMVMGMMRMIIKGMR